MSEKINIERARAKVEIYALLHPVSKEIMYIGKANDSQKRLITHIRDSSVRNTPVYCWIKKLLSENLKPEIKVISKIDYKYWQEEEIKLIEEYKNNGFRLLNVATGGDEPFCSKETRASNGIKVAKEVHSNPKRKQLWRLSKMISANLNFLRREAPELYKNSIEKLKLKNRPEILGKFYL